MHIHTHLFLAHGDVISNIALVNDPDFCPKEVYLLGTENNVYEVNRLIKLFEGKDVKIHIWPLNDPENINEARERVFEFITRPEAVRDIALNVTGGTKPMSLGAFEIFRDAGKPIYYFPKDQDDVVWLHRDDWKSYDLADTIKLSAYFTAHGKKLISREENRIPQTLCDLTNTIVSDVENYSNPITYMNKLATDACLNNLLSKPIDVYNHKNGHFKKLIDLFRARNLLDMTRGKEILFTSEEARRYANGVWLEQHVYNVLYNLRSKMKIIQDLARNVEIRWDQEEDPFEGLEINWGIEGDLVKNELDVALLADNRLYIIECKTVNYENNRYKSEDDEKAAGVLYKMKALKDCLGGARTHAMLVSYHALPNYAKKRAKDFDIDICCADEINGIENVFKRWISN